METQTKPRFKKYLLALALPVFFFAAPACEEDDPDTPVHVASPRDFLSADRYRSLVIQVVSVDGFAPQQTTLNNLSSFLIQRCNKPNGISFVHTAISSPGVGAYSNQQLADVEKRYRSIETHGNELTAFVYFADGEYAGNTDDEKVLGVTYDESSVAIFEKTVRDYSGGLLQPTEASLETCILLHEFGHVLGLVNNGSPAQVAHEDGSHPRHCNNEDCLMYWLVENSDISSVIAGKGVPQLDANCIADLKANGGK